MSKRKLISNNNNNNNNNNNLSKYLKIDKKEKNENDNEKKQKIERIDLGDGSEVMYFSRFIDDPKLSWDLFQYLSTDDNIPWSRPTIRVFGRSCLQPRDTCYVATPGLTPLTYSGYTPPCYPFDHFPPLMDLLVRVQNAIPHSTFNSLLLNRYNGGNDYVGWHSDDESLYGPTPLIASVSLGSERDFFLKRRPPRRGRPGDEGETKRLKSGGGVEQYSFALKHGSLLVMKGYTQRDWVHSVPKRAKVDGVRINLTFRLVL